MAGLLDSLFSGGGSSGGLLDFLRNNAMNQQMAGGLQSDQAQYGSPMGAMAQAPSPIMPANQPNSLDTAQWPQGPIGAPSQGSSALPPNAQPTQGQMPPQQPMPSFLGGQGQGAPGGNLMAGFANLNSGGNPITMLANVASGLATGQRYDRAGMAQQQQRELFEAYRGAGLTPSQALIAVLNPNAANAYLGGGQTDDIKEYQFAKREEPNLTFQQFMQRKRAVSGEYSLTPQYGTNEKGETVLIQTGKSGEAIQTKLPAGVKISSGVDKIDLGTSWGLVDKRNGQMIGQQPKDLRGAEREKEVGTAQGQASSKLPAAVIDAEETSKKIDRLLDNKDGLASIVGPIDQYRPSWTLGDSGRNALARLEQLQGGAFLQAFNTLKGGGAITEAEGRKAEQAIARMQRSQGEQDFREALMDFRDAINDGVRKLRASAGPDGSYPDAVKNVGGGAATQRIRLNADGTIAQ